MSTHEYGVLQAVLLGGWWGGRGGRRVVVKWCWLVRVERREMKQLFHRKAGIESQSPVVTLMRASVHAPEGRWQQRPGSAHAIFFWKWKWKRCMNVYVCSVIVPGVVGEGGISLCTVCTYLVDISLAAAIGRSGIYQYIQPFRLMLAN